MDKIKRFWVEQIWQKFSPVPLLETSLIPRGFKNYSYYLKTIGGEKYVLKIYAQSFLSDEILETDLAIANYLRAKNLPVIEFIPGRDGRYLQILESGEVRFQATCSVFNEAVVFQSESLNRSKVYSLARELGRLHLFLSLYKITSEFRKLTPAPTLREMRSPETVGKIKEYFNQNSHNTEHLERFIKEYLDECEKEASYFERAQEGLKSQLIHGDFNLSNVSFKEDTIAAICDFDEMTSAPLAFEVGCTLVHLDEGFMLLEDLFEYFIRSYREFNRGFLEREKEATIMFMRYRALYRIARYFTYYRFSERPVEHYTKYYYKLQRYKELSRVLLTNT